jgi:hypothetical protein
MEALGPILILLSIPLVLRWIPPNRVFGLFLRDAPSHDQRSWEWLLR